jgi:hypothetical protein
LSGLEAETGRDRRTIAKALGTTRPDGRLRGHDAWRLTTALRALERHDGRGRNSFAAKELGEVPKPDLPPCFQSVLACEVPEEGAILLGMLMLAYRLPAQLVSIAAGSGAPMKAVYALYGAYRYWMLVAIGQLLAEAKVAPWDGTKFPVPDMEAFDEVAWDRLAASVGEPVDLPGWEAWAQRCYGSEQKAE